MTTTTVLSLAADTTAWTHPRTGEVRHYLADEAKLRIAGLDVTRYNTGNIAGATLSGEKISNAEAGRILAAMGRAWTDGTTIHGVRDTRNTELAVRFAGVEIGA